MAYNNTVKLIGNLGKEARVVESSNGTFAALSVATTDSYKDQEGNWQDKETIWHDVVIFNPKLIESVKAFKKGTRLEIIGSLSYRPFEIQNDDGTAITKKEVSIVAAKVDQAPLVKKDQSAA
ncbi:single-stranded DNA-binding protein [Flavilitoribacter nigricans]|uniref:Single-stranded DNA-binding protein n=1 Tax=Flavilitoribacter nigricans (strain ATCC 23147 / DSM 23189 / NBRC 102662 / NCIMB 1420 / SS-2) TaxID=1122177 RepID=A0A2D0N7L6_FLAN2|nr:single-stranded DNA-binding protein [Flavilitoribacter nigricans]PHN04386.1 hypothetical protein CRP01_22775 [Flavilitoribacter nigricans DSM 23189 = NBRC 102662]